MKATTVTKYEASDGRTFTNKEVAQRHELELWCKGKQEDKDAKLTSLALINIMLAHPEEFAKKLKEVAG